MRKILKSKTFEVPWWNSEAPAKFTQGEVLFRLKGFGRTPEGFYLCKTPVEAFANTPMVDKIKVSVAYWQANYNPKLNYSEVVIEAVK